MFDKTISHDTIVIEMKKSIFILLLSITFLSFSNSLFAQGLNVQSDINIEIVPEFPKPYEKVGIFLTSYSSNLDGSKITWSINGKTIISKTGEKNLYFDMGGLGEEKNIRITILTPDGENFTKNFTLRPSSVDLIWESNGFVPPFYKGKSLFANQDKVRVIAIPHVVDSAGRKVDSSKLVYKWKKNGSVAQEASGYAKNVYEIEGSLISRPLNITVEASSIDNDGIGFGSINITPVNPEIYFYEKNPTYGILFQKALTGNVDLGNQNEISVIAFPYYFDSRDLYSGSINTKWYINNNESVGDENIWTQVFRKKEGASGTANIMLTSENLNRILQYTKSSFNITFNNE